MTENNSDKFETFHQTLVNNKLDLVRGETSILQINVGYLCNLACKHCHLEAGPARKEIMSRQTAEQVVDFASRHSFKIIDITGGAPEMNPNLAFLIEKLAPLAPKMMLRSNLVAMHADQQAHLVEILKKNRVEIVASFPALNEAQMEMQRGSGVFQESVEVLQMLNEQGFGIPGTGLELSLVVNPGGAFMPTDQAQQEKRFREVLQKKWNIEFSHLYSFANVPLGRFKKWLDASGNYVDYMTKLAQAFNPCALEGVMCRNLISVSWDGFLYDCDFNQALSLPLAGNKQHISRMDALPEPGQPIAVSDHCFSCTAGSGFT